MRVIGCGGAIPNATEENELIEKRFKLESGWVADRTGIKARPKAEAKQATSDLAVAAAEAAIVAAGIDRRELGFLVLSTSTPDHPLPPSAPLVAERLGLSNPGAIDLAGACAGFLYGLIILSHYSDASGKPGLVIGANVLTKRLDPEDLSTSVLFSDGAGCLVVEPWKPNDLKGFALGSNGKFYDAIQVEVGGSRQPTSSKALSEGRHFMKMVSGQRVFRQGVNMMKEVATDALNSSGMKISDIDWLIPHQANKRMINETARGLKHPVEKTISTIEKLGNSSAATIPLALSEASSRGRISSSDMLLMTAVGAGMVSASTILRWNGRSAGILKVEA